jgi:hypothetical protein
LCNYGSHLRYTLIIVGHSSWSKIMRAHMRRRRLRIAAHQSWGLKATTLPLKIKFLHLFLRPRYLNWRWYYVRILYRHRVPRIIYKFISDHVLLRSMRTISHIVNPKIGR